MLDRFSDFISRFWWLVILLWIGLLVLVDRTTPKWDDVTNDGDLAYMPSDMTSVIGEQLLEQAFPNGRSKSEMAVIISRDDHPLTEDDAVVVDQVAARLMNLLGVSSYLRAESLWNQAAEQRKEKANHEADKSVQEANQLQAKAVDAWLSAKQFDPTFAIAWNNLSMHYDFLGDEEEAKKHRLVAEDYDSDLEKAILPKAAEKFPIWDVWTYNTDIFGDKLKSKDKHAQLLVVHLSQEFMATENVPILAEINKIKSEVENRQDYPQGLSIGLTGSASVGADMLQSSAESIRNTEKYTVVLVVIILVLVYRSPLLIVVPLTTIIISLLVSQRIVAALTQVHLIPGFEWWNFKIFTTTKIFVIVILFGAGTDFCLFLISRFKEEIRPGSSRNNHEAVSKAISGVSHALIGSAFTTIVGLAMMFFADFGKFRNSGPAIGLCLAVTLIACLTLAPALIRALGKSIFWPFGVTAVSTSDVAEDNSLLGRFWSFLAKNIVSYPGRILVCCTLLMLPFAYMGTGVEVTYNFLSELDPDRPSKTGMVAMQKHFPIGETGPLVVLAKTDGADLDSDEGKKALLQLTEQLYVDGVFAVRSLAAPEGEKPKGKSIQQIIMTAYDFVRSLYLSKPADSNLTGDVARMEVVLNYEPFSLEAIEALNRIEQKLNDHSQNATSFWSGTQFVFSGTTAAIRDLRTVTRHDNIRIQILVVLGVLLVLLILLRRPLVCVYLIISVLFSYYATLGATEWTFKLAYGATFEGLDWKVPLFLFVILVAIGQDYNIYLVTRVFEEQQRHGLFNGLRRAIIRTGGIITSCGVIMAGTFISMTTGSLRGIVELGFALSMGVMLDTFVVRPIMVPSFLALLFKYKADASSIGAWFKIKKELQNVSSVSAAGKGPG